MSINSLKDAPSLQHLVRMIGPTPADTAKAILAKKPTIRTFEANHYIRAMLSGMTEEQVVSNALKDPRGNIRKTALEVIPLVAQYLVEHDFGWFRPLPPIFHQVSPSVRIPIKPLGIARVDGKVVIVWPQLWKTISLTPDQFNLFASYMKYGLLDKFPDYQDFHWLEMSAPKGKKIRELRVRTIDAAQILQPEHMLATEEKIEGALAIVATMHQPERGKRPKDPLQESFI